MHELIEKIRSLAAERAEIQAEIARLRGDPSTHPTGRMIVELLAQSAERAREIEALFVSLAKIDRAQTDDLRLELAGTKHQPAKA